MGEPSANKRRRLNPVHRWNQCETTDLLDAVLDAVKDNPEAFEKPTAQSFYSKIQEKCAGLQKLNWYILKSKFRNLKKTYVSAAEWKGKTGAGLLEEGKEQSVKEYIDRICPFWDILDQILGCRRSIHPPQVFDTETCGYEDFEMLMDTEDNNLDSIIFETNDDTFETTNNNIEELIDNSQPSTSSAASLNNCKNRLNRPKYSKKIAKNSDSISQLLIMQEKRISFEELKLERELRLEEQKLELDREKLARDLDIKQMEVQLKMETKKLEIERDERVAIEIKKLEVEADLKKYEINLKYKNN